jgi:hypothetical protein
MPLGAVCLVTTLACGYASLLFKNIRLIMLVLACLPVMAGCAMIWKGEWNKGGATPLAGYTLIGFFAPVTSLIVSMGMANVAGNSKKSFMASGTFVMYCVGEYCSAPCGRERRDADFSFLFRKYCWPVLDQIPGSQRTLPACLAGYHWQLRCPGVRRGDSLCDAEARERT